MAIARTDQRLGVLREAGHRLLVLLGAVVLTFAFFVVLPLMQTISRPPTDDLSLQTVDLANAEPPPPPPPEDEEPEPEPEPEETPPQFVEEAPPLDLSQLELALNPGFGDNWMGTGDFAVMLNTVGPKSGDDLDAVFSMADLDQKPRVIYQPGPTVTRQLRRKTPAKVNIIFIVDENGRVVEPKVRSSTDPLFEAPALGAVARWKFEPGKRGGKAVRFRMMAPITFPEG
jgi:periplasmic protein TonB